jgi:hypothetical protein
MRAAAFEFRRIGLQRRARLCVRNRTLHKQLRRRDIVSQWNGHGCEKHSIASSSGPDIVNELLFSALLALVAQSLPLAKRVRK